MSGSVEVAAAELWRAAVHLCVNGSFIFAHRQIVVAWDGVLFAHSVASLRNDQ